MPVSLIPAATQFVGGVLQTVFSGKKKAEKNLENYANSYQTPGSVLDYYNKALSRYSSNPYTSQLYNQQMQNVNRNLASGLSGLQSRRGGIAGVAALTQGANDAGLKAGVAAEGQQGQQLQQLAGATKMLSNSQEKKYDLLYNLKALKASAANQQQAAGEQNMFGGLSNASSIFGAKAKSV